MPTFVETHGEMMIHSDDSYRVLFSRAMNRAKDLGLKDGEFALQWRLDTSVNPWQETMALAVLQG